MTSESKRLWRTFDLKTGTESVGQMGARWEVEFVSIIDGYSAQEENAHAMFIKWAEQASSAHPDGLIPIAWWVWREAMKIEFMPFQFGQSSVAEHFLNYFEWTVDSVTGELLNWLELPVMDKEWNSRRSDNGGFIQEVTKWKPSVLQPYVYLPALESWREAPP